MWIKSCLMGSNFIGSFDSLDRSINLYGVTQVEDEIWLCGGETGDRNIEQSKSCRALSLREGKWRHLEQKMNIHRIRPVMFVAGRKVIVKGGSTSNIHSMSGCRNTQEVSEDYTCIRKSYILCCRCLI